MSHAAGHAILASSGKNPAEVLFINSEWPVRSAKEIYLLVSVAYGVMRGMYP